MPSLRECAIAAKAKYDEIIEGRETKGDDTIAKAAREFLFDCAQKDDWDTAEYFLDEFYEADFPLEKLNLLGDNNETIYWVAATNSDIAKANSNIALFVMHLGSYGRKIEGLTDKSDEYYYATHPEAAMKLLAEVATDEDSFI